MQSYGKVSQENPNKMGLFLSYGLSTQAFFFIGINPWNNNLSLA